MIIAIAPVVVPIVLALALGTGFAWLKLRKPTAASDAPAIDPAKPTLKMVSGGTTAELYRIGPVWAWKVDGAEPNTSTDADAGAAAVAMAQAFASSIADTPDAPIAGAASSASNDPLEFSIQRDEDVWDWSITREAAAKVPGVPAIPQSVALGSPTSRSRAVLEVLAALSQNLDWLTPIAPPEGGAAPQPEIDPTQLPGLRVSGRRLAVTSLPAWIAYASPLVREALMTSADADAIMDELLGNYPDDALISGKSLAVVQEKVNKVVSSIQDDTYLEVDSPDENVAAEIVGANVQALGHGDWWIGRYKDHVILVRPAKVAAAPGGFGINLGDRWEYLVWGGDARGYDTDVVERNVSAAGKARNQTIKAAKLRIDAGFPGFEGIAGVGTGTTFGGVAVPEAQLEPCGYGEYRNAEGVCVKAEDIKLDAVIERELVAPSWTGTTTQTIVLFDFATGANRARRDWTIGIGVCIEATSDAPFGTLTTLQGGGGEPFGDPMARFNIREAPKPGTVGGKGSAITDWEQFLSPVAYGAQYQMKFERGAFMPAQPGQPPGVHPVVKITKAPAKKDDDSLDECPNNAHWPVPDREAGFLVYSAGGAWFPWKSVPKLEIVTQGTRIVLRITVAGLPVFAGANENPPSDSALNFPTNYDVRVHVRATGMNP